MGTKIIEGVNFYPIAPIITTGGTVMHAVKGLDADLEQFGECYFSTAATNAPKAWKKHKEMTCNLFVPHGEVKFVFFDDRTNSSDFGNIREIIISKRNYGRLVISPGIWFGFAGIAPKTDSLVMNLADMKHDPEESMRLEPGNGQIPYQWTFNSGL